MVDWLKQRDDRVPNLPHFPPQPGLVEVQRLPRRLSDRAERQKPLTVPADW